ncbi:MAG: hypothetical protein JRG86_13850 [Deltaproteobacteria bacterium]|nr:hypothetical protein [Deltaproteobacteria bacterium]MBW2498154.1 hypothetical protein [Deltaproteobacteria bacterium]
MRSECLADLRCYDVVLFRKAFIRDEDLFVFDNTGLVYGAMPFEDGSPRLLYRTTLVGEERVA